MILYTFRRIGKFSSRITYSRKEDKVLLFANYVVDIEATLNDHKTKSTFSIEPLSYIDL